ncbi:MAG: tetratricopeptide repeat protein [Anaerolineae bacterium]|nr:tetratricopeptide repeat protein [Anaerolineae bacterium]
MTIIHTITVRLYPAGATYAIELTRADESTYQGSFAPLYTPETWAAIQRALEPDFDIAQADDATRKALLPLGNLAHLREIVGQALANALLATDAVREGFDVALHLAARERQALAVTLRFAAECHTLAGLPWELLHYDGRFLVADSSVALSRYPDSSAPPTEVQLAALPMRVLLVLAEPLDASPIFPERAREQLLHGLRSLDEEGAVIVDELRPPTFDTLVEAVTNGEYHLVIFYGHGVYDPDLGGLLLFEDEFGGQARVKAAELGAILRNTSVRLVMLGACQSAQVSESGGLWSGTAPALVQAGVPMVVGMQVSMLVTAAQAFIRQFALSLAAGKPIGAAVADARKSLIRDTYGQQWFVPVVYGRPFGVDRLFDATTPTPQELLDLRGSLKAHRAEIVRLERAVSGVGTAYGVTELADLRAAKRAFARDRALLARYMPGGYTQVISPLYGVPTNPIFVGRTDALQQVGQGFRARHPVVIWGAGGIGKTALAAEVAQRQSWHFPGGVLWLDCRGGPALDILLNRIGAFCGIQGIEQVEPEQKEERVRYALAGLEERCLLVFDNAEDVWDKRDVRQLVGQRLPNNAQVLLTTRENPEQAMWPTVELPPLVDEAMTTLFYRLAVAAGVKVGAQADLDAIPDVISWLQGHPLALMLVVPLMAKRGIRRVWLDLQQQPLKGVEAAFAVSYNRLTTTQQQLFMRLSVFAISFEWEAAEVLLPGEENVDEALDVLVQRALVSFDGARYAYHALLRQYGYARLQDVGDPRPVHRLVAKYLRSKITDRSLGGTPEEILEEVDQWESAEAWEDFARNANDLVGSLDRVGYWEEIRVRLMHALETVRQQLDLPDLEAYLLQNLGVILTKQVKWDQAVASYEQSLVILERSNDMQGIAQVSNNLGFIFANKGEWDRAIKYYERSLAIKERTNDTLGIAKTKENLANVYALKGEWNLAAKMYEENLVFYERIDDVHQTAMTLNNLGLIYTNKGEWDRAITMYDQSLVILERVSDIHGMSSVFCNLGGAYLQKGQWDKALRYYKKSLAASEHIGDELGKAKAWMGIGQVYESKRKWNQAIKMYEQSLAIQERVGDVLGTSQTLSNLGSVYLAKGEWDRAATIFEQSLVIKERIGDVGGLARTQSNLASTYAAKGEWDQAIAMHEKSLLALERIGDIHGMAIAWINLGILYARKGKWDQATDYYEQSVATFDRVGDVHGMAQALVELGRMYVRRGKLNQAAAVFKQSLTIFQNVGDVYNMGKACGNLGLLYEQVGRSEEAKAYLARAYLAFGQIDDDLQHQAAQDLVQACGGSTYEAKAYLARFAAKMETRSL